MSITNWFLKSQEEVRQQSQPLTEVTGRQNGMCYWISRPTAPATEKPPEPGLYSSFWILRVRERAAGGRGHVGKMGFLWLHSWSSAEEQLRRTFTPSLTENGKKDIFYKCCHQQHNLNMSKISQLCVPEMTLVLHLTRRRKVRSNYCHISWAKAGRSKCPINSFFPMGVVNDTVRCILPAL